MADRPQPHQLQVRPGWYGDIRAGGGMSQHQQHQGPSTGKVLAAITGLPVGGTLLGLSGLTLIGTIIGALLATPLFIIFSPVLVPAAFVIGLAVTGFLASGALGLTALSSLSWVTNCLRRATGSLPEVKRRTADVAEHLGQKTKEVGQDIQNKAREEKRQTGHENR